MLVRSICTLKTEELVQFQQCRDLSLLYKLWSYWKAKVPFPVETNVCQDNFVLAYKKKVAEKNLLGIMNINKGKQPISLRGYNEFCEVVMTLIPCENQFPWKMTIFA